VDIFTEDGIRSVERPRSRFLNILAGRKGKKPQRATMAGTVAVSGKGSRKSTTSRDDKLSNNHIPTSPATQQRDFGTTPWRQDAKQRRPRYSKSAADMSAVVPKPTRSSRGTNSVYGGKRRIPMEESPAEGSRRFLNKEPQPVRSVSVRAILDTCTNAVSPTGSAANTNTNNNNNGGAEAQERRKNPGTANTRVNGESNERRRRSKRQSNKVVPDSTWIFPVGSRVVHKQLGTGTVLPPNPIPPQADGNTTPRCLPGRSTSKEPANARPRRV